LVRATNSREISYDNDGSMEVVNLLADVIFKV
jgi:hypothetical protein